MAQCPSLCLGYDWVTLGTIFTLWLFVLLNAASSALRLRPGAGFWSRPGPCFQVGSGLLRGGCFGTGAGSPWALVFGVLS